MTNIKEGSVLFRPERLVRAKLEDESVMLDRTCPKCGNSLIGKWSWSKRAYVHFRCQALTCKYGNEGIMLTPKLPPLEFDI